MAHPTRHRAIRVLSQAEDAKGRSKTMPRQPGGAKQPGTNYPPVTGSRQGPVPKVWVPSHGRDAQRVHSAMDLSTGRPSRQPKLETKALPPVLYAFADFPVSTSQKWDVPDPIQTASCGRTWTITGLGKVAIEPRRSLMVSDGHQAGVFKTTRALELKGQGTIVQGGAPCVSFIGVLPVMSP